MVNIDMNTEKVNRGGPNIIIITGEKQCGKTTACEMLYALLKKQGVKCGGVLCPGSETRSFHLLRNDTYLPFSAGREEKAVQIRKFRINARHFGKAKSAIIEDLQKEVLFIDEIGILEMQDLGFYPEFAEAVNARERGLVLVCRKSIVDEFLRRYCPDRRYNLFSLRERNSEKLAFQLLNILRPS